MRRKDIQFSIPWPNWADLWRWARKYLLPNPGTVILIALLFYAQAVGAGPFKAATAQSTTIPRLISYQGRLTDAVGDPVANDSYRMVFSLYCNQTGGEAFWTEDRDATNKVPVSNGFFNVLLGQLSSMPASFPCPDGNVYLGIRVDPDPTEMEPRELLASVPYAFQAVEVPNGSITTEKIADGAVTQAKVASDVSIEPPDGSVTTIKIADGAVTSAKLEHSGPHIPITPDENGLVKMAVMRQDDTTSTYLTNQVILTGWGFIKGSGTGDYVVEDVTFGVTFSDIPIVVCSSSGWKDGSDPISAGNFTQHEKLLANAQMVTATGFKATVRDSSGATIANSRRVGYHWIAIGTLE